MANFEIRHNLGEVIDSIVATQKDVRRAMERSARDIADELGKRYRVTYQSWTHTPDVDIDVHFHARRLDVEVATDRIYNFVDQGTRPHAIFPVRASRLHFLSDYQPKTLPGVLGSGTGGAYGSDVFARAVQHPGTEARGFTERILRDARDWSYKLIWEGLLKMLNRRRR